MKDNSHPSEWKYISPVKDGFHHVVTPENSPCTVTWIFRLNLGKGKSFTLSNDSLELNGAVVKGKISITHNKDKYLLNKLDSFYLPARENLEIEAEEDAIVFIGGSLYEGKGKFFTRKYDLTLPLGDIHQIHGKPPYKREVFMTLAQQDEGSRLICGITTGEKGQWTSWPPHQHSEELEEVYCYFDIPYPLRAFHYASRKSGDFEYIHPVSSGDCVVVPEGYHPTCGMPGVKSTYFWVMAAHKPETRRYDLAVNDPVFDNS
jgi:5-deoxy-glucuronate isomerase